MKSCKKWLSLLLSAVLLLGCLPLSAVAADDAGRASFVGSYVTLGDELDVTFVLSVPSALRPETLTVSFDVGGKTATVPLTADGDTYTATVKVSAKQMTAPIVATLCDGDETVHDTKTYTVAEYASYLIAGNFLGYHKDVARAMLNYGAAAQLYFNYRTDDLANADCAYTAEELAAVNTADLPSLTAENGLENYLGATLLLRDTVGVRLYFEGEVEGGTAAAVGWYRELSGIGAANLSTVFELAVEDATYAFSVLSFAKTVIEGDYSEPFQHLMRTIVLYSRYVDAIDGTAPLEGFAYKLSVDQKNLSDTLYVTHTVDNARYLKAIPFSPHAPDFYVEKTDGGYYIYTYVDSVKQYVTATTGPNALSYTSDATTVFSYDTALNVWCTNIGGTDFAVGTYNTYATISLSYKSYYTETSSGVTQFPMAFALSSAQRPTDAEIVDAAYDLMVGTELGIYTLTGTVLSVNTAYNPSYGNITVTIEVEGKADKPVMCYRLKGDGAETLAAGDVITVTGKLINYDNQSETGLVEFAQGCTLDAVEKFVPPELDEDCTHVDADNDNYCDLCDGYVVVIIDFYAVNDLHGKFEDTDEQFGVDEMTTYFKNAQATDEAMVLLSTGDMWQGSPESNLTQGAIITEWMNSLSFEAMTLGNHEYDWGREAIESNAAIADFPYLAINVYDVATNERADYAGTSVLIEREGLQIGIIGAIGDCYSSISADKVEDVYFKVGDELTALVKAESDRLREAGADVIVYMLHDGFNGSFTGSLTDEDMASYYDGVLSEGYVDLVFEAHTHQQYIYTDDEGIFHLQGGGDNSGLSHVEMAVNIANDSKWVQTASIVDPSTYAHLNDDPIVDELMEKYDDTVGFVYEVIGTNSADRDSQELKELVAKLYYEAGMEQWGEQYDIALGGGYLSIRSPYVLRAGDVNYAKLLMLLPFDNALQLCSISGADLLSRFYENSGYVLYYEEYGENLRENIDPEATYYVVVDTYNSTYADNNLTVIDTYDPAETYARDFLAEYVKAGGLE